MKLLVKFLTVTEIELDSDEGDAVERAQATLDFFRESTLPSKYFGVTLYRATPDDLTTDLLISQVEVVQHFGNDSSAASGRDDSN